MLFGIYYCCLIKRLKVVRKVKLFTGIKELMDPDFVYSFKIIFIIK